jgi:hypothetical protein
LTASRRIISFINIGQAIDSMFMLIFPPCTARGNPLVSHSSPGRLFYLFGASGAAIT